ncbi:calcium-binding protein [Paracoccus lutimaris]|nr:hypothetical protein [Paracoccus lutimaris]
MALLFSVAIFNGDDDSPATDRDADELTLDPETGTVTGTGGDDVIDLDEPGSSTDGYMNVSAGGGNDTVTSEHGGMIFGEAGDDLLTVLNDNGGVTDGGAGNDVLNVTPIAGQVLGGEGNDTINYDGNESLPETGITVDAGAGDDVVNVESGFATLFGGTGNDTLSVTGEAGEQSSDGYIDLGDGHDLLILDGEVSHDFRLHDGEGDDTIRVLQATASPDESGVNVRWINSGAGNDVYEFTLSPDENAQHFDDPDAMGYAHAAIILDFEAGEDRLVVDPYSLAGDATYTGHELTLANSTGYQEVVFHYTHPDYPEGLAVSVAVTSGRITAEDIEITGAPTPAA